MRTHSFNDHYTFGKSSEEFVLKYLSKFSSSPLKQCEDVYSPWDFESDEVLIELKSRIGISSTTYDTTIINYRKIMRAAADTTGRRILFAVKLSDGLFVIEYDAEEFEKYEIRMIQARHRSDKKERLTPHICIPIKDFFCVKKFQTVRLILT